MEVDLKSRIDICWLEELKPLNKQPGKLAKTSEDTADCPHICDMVDSKLLHDVKLENIEYLDQVVVSEDVDPLSIEVNDEDKYSPLVDIAVKDEEDSLEKPVEVKGEYSAGEICNPLQEHQTSSTTYSYTTMNMDHDNDAILEIIIVPVDIDPLEGRQASEEHTNTCDLDDERFFKEENPYGGKNVERNADEDKYPERNFGCLQCGSSFSTKWQLEKHLKVHSGERSYFCLECGKAFFFKQHLRQHEKSHTGIRPHACKLCNKAFTAAYNLRRHLRYHAKKNVKHGEKETVERNIGGVKSPEAKFTCAQCGKTFTNKWNLTNHIICHSGVRPYSCSECGKTFALKEYLTGHKKSHSEVRPLTCKFCNKTFRKAYNLLRHTRSHTKEKPFNCKQCAKCFSDKGSLNKHLRRMHKEKILTGSG